MKKVIEKMNHVSYSSPNTRTAFMLEKASSKELEESIWLSIL